MSSMGVVRGPVADGRCNAIVTQKGTWVVEFSGPVRDFTTYDLSGTRTIQIEDMGGRCIQFSGEYNLILEWEPKAYQAFKAEVLAYAEAAAQLARVDDDTETSH